MKKFIVVITLVLTILSAQFFGLGLSLPVAYADDLTGSSTSDSPNIYDFITGLTITKIAPDDSDALGSDVPQNGEFRMTYSFTIPQNSGLRDIDYFFLDLPDYVNVPSNVTNVNIVDSTYNLHVLDVSMLMPSHASNTTGEDAIRVDFTSQLEANTDTFVFSGEFWFEANFDADEVDAGGPITINFDSGRTSAPYAINIDFVEDPPVQPTFAKSVSRTWNSADNRHYYTWTLNLNPENVDLGSNVVITDELDFMTAYLFDSTPANVLGTSNGTDLRFMEYIGNVTQTNGTAAYTIGYTDTGVASEAPILTISFTEPVTERQTFTFETAVYANAYINLLQNGRDGVGGSGGSRDLDFDNDVEAATDLGTITSNVASSNYNIDVINKNRIGSVDTVNRTITYRIEANPYDYIVDNAYVTDQLPDGLTMDETTITFTYDDGLTPVPGASYAFDNVDEVPLSTDDSYYTGDYYVFDLGNITEEVWINFVVTIDDDQYYDQANITYRNDAYFHPPSNSEWYNRGRRDVPVTTDVLQKTTTAIDITNGIITWQLVINPNTNATNPVALADIVVTDPIPTNISTTPATTNNGLSYVPGSLTLHDGQGMEDEVTGATATYDSVNNQIVIDFDPDDTSDGVDVIDEEYRFTFQTQIEDAYIYKRNADSSVANTASYTSFNAGSGNDSATRSINPDMLQKSFVSYNYDTHNFRWHIHANPNNNELFNAVITDYISEDMVYIPGTFVIYDSGSNPYTDGAFSYTGHDPTVVNPQVPAENISGTLEYTFPAIVTDSYDIYFETEYVDYAQLSDNHLSLTSDYLEATNTAYFVHDELPTDTYVVIGDSERFTSSVVEKAPEYSSGEQYIDWVLTINKNQIEILGPSPVPDPESPPVVDGPIIYDNLQEGLVLDLDSIMLYNATVNSDNSITVDRTSGSADEVSYDRNSQVTYDSSNNRQLTFAFADTINTCYVMTFRTYIEAGYRNTDFNNTASFHALAGNENNTSGNERVLFATGGGYAAANIGHLLLTKVDADSGLPLSGATFELIDADGVVVDTKVTDTSGEALFEFVFFDRQYYYKESIPPYGYSADTSTLTPFVIDTATATDQPDDPDRTHTPDAIENTANDVAVEFYKYTQDGITGLQGAIFAIYDQSTPTVEIDRQTSDTNGLVAFTGLPAKSSYNIVELSAPLGFVRYTGTLTVDVTVGGPFNPTPSSITNAVDVRAVGTIRFMKYAENGVTPLADCVFGIYSVSEPTLLRGTATSLADGTVTFVPVAPGDYIIRELSAPTSYEVSSTELTATVGDAPGIYTTTPESLTNYIERIPSINPQTGDASSSMFERIMALLIMIVFILFAGIYVYNSYKKHEY